MKKVLEKRLFGTDGIRGVANQYPMTPEVALSLGRALAYAFRQTRPHPRILIGKDTRLSGYMLETAVASGVTSMGADVLLVGPMPTPAIAFLTQGMRASAGVMISASHNLFQDNGIKVFDEEGYKLTDEREREIETLMFLPELEGNRPSSEGIGKAFRVEEAKGRVIEFLKGTFPRDISLEGMKIAVDCAHGAAYEIAPTVFQELGAEVTALGVAPDGTNINKDCGALLPESTGRTVVQKGLDIGIALDGDADRVIFMDDSGKVVEGDAILAICADDLLKTGRLGPKGMVGTLMSNFGLEEYLARRDLQLIRVPVGDRYIIEEMQKKGYRFGGEPSGHIIFRHYSTTGDGILAALQVLSVMRRREQSLAELVRDYIPYPQVLKNVKVSRREDLSLYPLLQQRIRRAEQELGKKGRLLVRYSGTEPMIRVMVEGQDLSLIQTVADEIASLVAKNLA